MTERELNLLAPQGVAECRFSSGLLTLGRFCFKSPFQQLFKRYNFVGLFFIFDRPLWSICNRIIFNNFKL
ncbi:hypothetical protein COX74_00265 [bacterium (Candidatus Gribaldobacteria) CG_4_10_14_0_2_um_filter_41_16]|uniref:Uncharacterized protein n=1 Tax=bacterium (Candidatus Gribaldobacteria) CG_4_10_14_0_2_um_filter_41_16 TaxID=2014265 RepID=A0A2M7VJ77_9BACT|nr:MAG: hypothetical protein COX74_00265 [bacterium (Candidatus Gribaldobacteria) CG_4_10_14_0_2_um_filter_41_16]